MKLNGAFPLGLIRWRFGFRTALTISITGLLVALAVIWIPILRHHFVWQRDLPEPAASIATAEPTDAVLESTYLDFTRWPLYTRAHLHVTALAALEQKAVLPGMQPVSLREYSKHLLVGRDTDLLAFSSLAVPYALLLEYESTGRRDYLDASLDYVVRFAKFEAGLLPKGQFVRNDHAMGARVAVLIRLWRHSRASASPATRRLLLALMQRHLDYLVRPSHFRFATNHGIIQNLALLQLAVAFPTMPGARSGAELAMRRLRSQMPFYTSSEGIVLEHGSGYHLFGMRLLSGVIALAEQLHLSVPADWRQRLALGVDALRCMRRPDGTLPVIGETHFGEHVSEGELQGLLDIGGASGITLATPCSSGRPYLRIFPVSGLATLGIDDSARVSVSWMAFPEGGHFQNNQLSLDAWLGGVPWLTNVGYWQIGDKLQSQALGWRGSNAPHWEHEAPAAARTTHAVLSGVSPNAVALIVERRGTKGQRIARQVVLAAGWLLVVDAFTGDSTKGEVIWTLAPHTGSRATTAPGAFALRSAGGMDAGLRLDGGGSGKILQAKGLADPFVGWLSVDSVPTPTTAWQVSTQRTAPARMSMMWLAQREFRSDARLTADSESEWQLRVPGEPEPVVWRRGSVIGFGGQQIENGEIRLRPVITQASVQNEISSAFTAAKADYGRFRELLPYRVRVSWAVVVLGVLNLLALRLLAVRSSGATAIAAGYGVLSVIGWIFTSWAIAHWYLA